MMFDDLLKAFGFTPAEGAGAATYKYRPTDSIDGLDLTVEMRPGETPQVVATAKTPEVAVALANRLSEGGYTLTTLDDGSQVFRKGGCPDVTINGVRFAKPTRIVPSSLLAKVEATPGRDDDDKPGGVPVPPEIEPFLERLAAGEIREPIKAGFGLTVDPGTGDVMAVGLAKPAPDTQDGLLVPDEAEPIVRLAADYKPGRTAAYVAALLAMSGDATTTYQRDSAELLDAARRQYAGVGAPIRPTDAELDAWAADACAHGADKAVASYRKVAPIGGVAEYVLDGKAGEQSRGDFLYGVEYGILIALAASRGEIPIGDRRIDANPTS